MSFLKLNPENPGVRRPVRVSDLQQIWTAIAQLFDTGGLPKILCGFNVEDGYFTPGVVALGGNLYAYTGTPKIAVGATLYGLQQSTGDIRIFADRTAQLFSYENIITTAASDIAIGIFTIANVETWKTWYVGTSQITRALIASGAVVSDKLAVGAVTYGKIATDAVTTSEIKDLAVTSGKLANLSVTTNKIADGAVTGNKILDASLRPTKLQGVIGTYRPWSCLIKITGINYAAHAGNVTVEVEHKDFWGADDPLSIRFNPLSFIVDAKPSGVTTQWDTYGSLPHLIVTIPLRSAVGLCAPTLLSVQPIFYYFETGFGTATSLRGCYGELSSDKAAWNIHVLDPKAASLAFDVNFWGVPRSNY